MNEQMGLAGQGMGPQDGSGNRQMIEQVKAALMQGMSPEELVQNGVPQEVVQMAIQELQAEQGQQAQAQGPAVTPAGQGLAGQGVA